MALLGYSLCDHGSHYQSTPYTPSVVSSSQVDQKPLMSSSQCTINQQHKQHAGGTSVSSRLKHYQSYLDDHDTFRRRRSKWVAMKKYSSIMRSIKTKSKDLFQFEYHEEDDEDEDEEFVDGEENSGDPFERTPPTSHNLFFGGSRQSTRSATSAGLYGRKCDTDDCNKILRRYRARIVNDSNHFNPVWESSDLVRSQRNNNNNQNHFVTHNSDALTRMDCFI